MPQLPRGFEGRGQRASLALLVATSVFTTSVAHAQDVPAPPPAGAPSPPPSAPPAASAYPQTDSPPTPPAKAKTDDTSTAPPLANSPALRSADPVTRERFPGPLKAGEGRFQFGSYGRVIASVDGRGRSGRDADLVARGSRLDEGNYAELELRREDDWRKSEADDTVTTRIVTTTAFADPLFHSSGKFDATIAVRNLYIEERGIGSEKLAVWAGSRMYRGDDVYLLDWWPLDNLSTLGGGVRYDVLPRTTIALHAGANRLDDPFQYQQVDRQKPLNQVGTTRVTLLDRPRIIETARAEHHVAMPAIGRDAGLKFVAYSEFHQISSGERELSPGRKEYLPREKGFVVGGEIGGYTGERDTYLNLFVRYASGVAAYGDFSVPYALNADKTADGASELRIAFSGNVESGPFTLLAGGYFRKFTAAAEEKLNLANLSEGAIVLRPHLYFTDKTGVFVEGSYQAQERAILAADGQGPQRGTLVRFGVAPFLSPAGRGSYRRPQIRAIWVVTARDDGARSFYPTDDPFATRRIDHFIGIGAEWWFNSSYRLSDTIMGLGRTSPLRYVGLTGLLALSALSFGGAGGCQNVDEQKRTDLATHVSDWRNEIIYQVLVDRFANGDHANDFNVVPDAPARYHGGDWKGLEDRLDYIEALGVTTLWISPVVKNVETDADVDGYHGYWAQDLTKPNPHFGDIGSLRRMIRKAHDRDIKVVLDIVTNHLGQLFFYDINLNGKPDIQIAESGRRKKPDNTLIPVTHLTEYDPDYESNGVQAFTSLGPAGPAPIIFVSDPAANKLPAFPAIFQEPRAYHRRGRIYDYDSSERRCIADETKACSTCATTDEEKKANCFDFFEQTRFGDFPGGLKDVATELPEVRAAMVDAYSRWVEETDLDGFRIDTLKHVEHGFWQTFGPAVRTRLAAQGKKNFFMFGESFDGDDARNGSYTRNQEVDSVFYFAQKYQVFDDLFKNHKATTKLRELWDQKTTNYATEPLENSVGVAPSKLIVGFLDNHDVARFLFEKPDTEVLRSALFLLLTADGIPCIYYGTEQEFKGGNDPANREDLWLSGYRTDGPTFQFLSRMTRIRRGYAALTKGDTSIVWESPRTGDESDAGMLAYERTGGDAGESYALVVINTRDDKEGSTSFEDATMKTSLPGGTELVDVLTEDTYVVGADGSLVVSLPAKQRALLIPQSQRLPGL